MKKFIFLTAALLTALPHAAAIACTCEEMTPEHSRAVIDDAALIFEGTVVGLDQKEQPAENFDYTALPVTENPLYAKARLKVRDLYKGTAEDNRLDAYIDTMTDCGYLVQIGDITTFVLNDVNGVLVQADTCSQPLPQDWKKLQAGEFRE